MSHSLDELTRLIGDLESSKKVILDKFRQMGVYSEEELGRVKTVSDLANLIEKAMGKSSSGSVIKFDMGELKYLGYRSRSSEALHRGPYSKWRFEVQDIYGIDLSKFTHLDALFTGLGTIKTINQLGVLDLTSAISSASAFESTDLYHYQESLFKVPNSINIAKMFSSSSVEKVPADHDFSSAISAVETFSNCNKLHEFPEVIRLPKATNISWFLFGCPIMGELPKIDAPLATMFEGTYANSNNVHRLGKGWVDGSVEMNLDNATSIRKIFQNTGIANNHETYELEMTLPSLFNAIEAFRSQGLFHKITLNLSTNCNLMHAFRNSQHLKEVVINHSNPSIVNFPTTVLDFWDCPKLERFNAGGIAMPVYIDSRSNITPEDLNRSLNTLGASDVSKRVQLPRKYSDKLQESTVQKLVDGNYLIEYH